MEPQKIPILPPPAGFKKKKKPAPKPAAASKPEPLPPAEPKVQAQAPAPKPARKLRVALAAWEIGRRNTGLGVKIGGLGSVMEELPAELVAAAAAQGLDLEVDILSPCFAHYDRSRLHALPVRLPAVIEGYGFEFSAYEHVFEESAQQLDGTIRKVSIRSVYFWDHWQLSWTGPHTVYPSDPWMGLKLYAAVCQAMAGYIKQVGYDTVHLHDYHVGLVPFYLGDDFLKSTPVHFTVHNASYQGVTPLVGGGFASLGRINLPGDRLFHKYFDFFDNLNPTKAVMLKVHENGGRIATVSGDLEGGWGYAAELRESAEALRGRAWLQKGSAPREVFLPNRGLDLFEKLPVAGITNGLSAQNWPQRMPELKAAPLQAMQDKLAHPIFEDPEAQAAMLGVDHDFDSGRLEVKQELRRLLYKEAFGHDIWGYPAIFGAVGRMVEQKNFELIAEIIEPVLAHDPQARFVILASAPDAGARWLEDRFRGLAAQHAGRVCFRNTFNQPLSKLILAGSDFVLVPSRFEPCGLVDYEAALLGTLPIVRAIGGLTKVRHCGYLYDWLDIGDAAGEQGAFFNAIREALRVYRDDYPEHLRRLRAAMATDASWDRSAAQYVDMYRYGILAKLWVNRRQTLIGDFLSELGPEQDLFRRFHAPARQEYGDHYDWELKYELEKSPDPD
ncbi:MAG: glycogen/starch synthase [Elusimicrobiota bacterium]|jgi:glycogen synthase